MVSMGMAIDLSCGRNVWGAYHSSGRGQSVSLESVPSFPVSTTHRVLIVEKEIGYEDFQIRLNAMWSCLSPEDQARVDENLLVESCNLDVKLDTTDGTKVLGNLIQQARADVVILDPLVEFHGQDENSVQGIGVVFSNLDLLRYKLGFATVLVHHRTKMSRDPNAIDDDSPESLRGSSRVFGKVDSVMMLRPTGKPGQLHASFTLRRGRPIFPLRLKVDLDTLATRFDGWCDQKPLSEQESAFRM
jgi:hypothetical protein